ncbi:MAG TPA: LysE/ArgO family amino acid transporter [Symbiobacteriaceae bacterium]|nr:LysE/ArgO family amino acid transporter [Symbiobacteriaceae bacterium]
MKAAVLHGLLLAFGLILPLGVQNTFVFTQGALHRRWVGALPSVLMASVCDTLLITAAVSGLSVVVLAAPWVKGALSWAGVAFLLYMGWATWRTEPSAENAAEEWPARRQAVFAASVSLLNPHAILDTVGVIGTSSLTYAGAPRLGFTLACVGVSWLWFAGLAMAGHLLGVAAGGVAMRRWLNRISALIMWGVAIQLLVL